MSASRILQQANCRFRVWMSAFILAVSLAGCSPPEEPDSISDEHFQRLILEFSEDSGYFDTDNLISNETCYQHALSVLPPASAKNRAYIGVGPSQNLTYISQLEPRIAFIVDIRRDNLLLHLYWKELFRMSGNRWEFLSALFAKALPEGSAPQATSGARDLVSFFEAIPFDESVFEERFSTVWTSLRKRFPELVQDRDKATLVRLTRPFAERNLDLRFRSHGRRPRSFYPSLQDLILATDLFDERRHFLETSDRYQALKDLQDLNRVLPVVGDFGGKKALPAVADYLEERQLPVSVFYASNVEFYLFRNGTFRQFAENLKGLPRDSQSFIIRSHFGNFGVHPTAEPGHFATAILQSLDRFAILDDASPYWDYWDLVTRDYIPLRRSRVQD